LPVDGDGRVVVDDGRAQTSGVICVTLDYPISHDVRSRR